ncbi:hypothetical protein P171DRAFT_262739 [Karstenula rhodostoma CBS 690.94]|uniref:Uncharacterized protein n=1 Tax=Karstenula rhodostoma CBS 690.94 TaxID=1392251 RepID=A0A9P4PPM2_9PLEO|nr:hypothetical protein P171DRAFT_262739 [Karstenula rhodostoma CBS 690.94]
MQSGSSITDSTSLNKVETPTQEPTPTAARVHAEVLPEGSEVLSASGCTTSSLIESTFSPKLADRMRKASQATVDSEQSQAKASPTVAQQFVWSAHDGRSMRPKTKRKMTVEERNAYKNTRKRGACDKCRKQKGRCTHINDDYQWQTSVETKRRSADLDAPPQEGAKSIKMEHSSDVHYKSSSRQNLEDQRVMSTEPPSLYQHVGPPTNRSHDEERGNEYVQSQTLISPFTVQTGKDQEPWSTFATRDPLETSLPGYILSPNVTQSLSSPQTPFYGFEDDLSFYEGTWNTGNPSQGQITGFPPPG